MSHTKPKESSISFEPYQSLLVVDSRRRHSGNVTDFTIDASSSNIGVERFQLSSIQMYLEIPNVNKYNNKVYYYFQNASVGPITAHVVTVANGIYTRDTLGAAVAAAMTGTPAGLTSVGYSYNAALNQMRFQMSDLDLVYFYVGGSDSMFGGSDALAYPGHSNLLNQAYVTTPHLCYTRYFKIFSPEMSEFNINPNVVLGSRSRALLNIYELANPGAVQNITQAVSSYSFKWFFQQRHRSLQIQLTDDKDRELELLDKDRDYLLLGFRGSRGDMIE